MDLFASSILFYYRCQVDHVESDSFGLPEQKLDVTLHGQNEHDKAHISLARTKF
jgi:hypothetical protein